MVSTQWDIQVMYYKVVFLKQTILILIILSTLTPVNLNRKYGGGDFSEVFLVTSICISLARTGMYLTTRETGKFGGLFCFGVGYIAIPSKTPLWGKEK